MSKKQELIDAVVADFKANGYESKTLAEKLTALREYFLEIEDPLLVKTTRLIKELIEEERTFEVELEEELEEGEEADEPMEFDEENTQLEYLLQLISKSDNKMNREEIKQYRTSLLELV